MVHIRQYLFSIITAAVICAIIRGLTNKKNAPATVVHFVSSVFLVIIVLLPWSRWSFSDISAHIKDYSDNAQAIANNGVSAAKEEMTAIIITKTETYIVNKAESLGVALCADVIACDESTGQPTSVMITANTSPYLRQVVSQYISADLGIPEANQVWS